MWAKEKVSHIHHNGTIVEAFCNRFHIQKARLTVFTIPSVELSFVLSHVA